MAESSKVLSIFDPLSSTPDDAPLGEEGGEEAERARSGEKEGSTTTDRRADVLSTFDPLTSTERDENSSAASAINDHSQSKLISDVKGLSIQSGEPVKPVYSQAGQTVTAAEESTPLPFEDQITGTSSSLGTIAEDPPTGDLLSMGAHSATSASVVSPPAPPNRELPWQPNVDQPGYVMGGGGGGRGGTNLPRKAKRKSSRSSATKSSPKKTSANFPAVSPSTVSGASHVTGHVTSADVAMATTVGSSAPVMGDHMMSSMKIQSEMLQIDSILKVHVRTYKMRFPQIFVSYIRSPVMLISHEKN